MDDSELCASVVELLNQSKEIRSLNVIPARRTCRARESRVRELENRVAQ